VLLSALIAVSAVASSAVEQGYVSAVLIEMYYYVDAGYGVVNQTVVLAGNATTVSIPVLKPLSGNLTIAECVDDRGRNLTCMLGDDTVVVSVESGVKSVVISYIVYNFFDEIAPGTYAALISLSPYEKTGYIEVKLYVPREYSVSATPSTGFTTSVTGDYAVAVFRKPLDYIVVLSLLNLGTGGAGPGVSTAAPGTPLLVIVAAVAAAALVAYLALTRVKHGRIEVETMPSSILEDETSKAIIKILGEAGESGVKQSDLVKLTGKPKASISRRVKRLAEEGYIEVVKKGKYNIVKLTDKGVQVYRNMKRGGER